MILRDNANYAHWTRWACTLDFKQQAYRRILLVRNDRIGDLVLTLPAIEAVRRHFPRAHLAALVSSYAGPLLAGHRAINELLVDDPAEGPFQLGKRLGPMKFNAALVFNTNSRNCLAVWRAGIRQRVCHAYKTAGFLLGTSRVAVHRSHPPIHEADFALEFVRRFGIETGGARPSPNLNIEMATRKRVRERIEQELGSSGPLFGVHPGNKNSAYNWPPERYAELVCRLAQHGRVMVTGSPAEQPLLDAMRARLDPPRLERVGFYTDFQLPELAAALSAQTALTVSSTGPMHIAAALGTPVVALFSPHPAHSPLKWAPLGSGHTLFVAPLERGEAAAVPAERAAEVMARITVEQVLAANLEFSRQSSAGSNSGCSRPDWAA